MQFWIPALAGMTVHPNLQSKPILISFRGLLCYSCFCVKISNDFHLTSAK